MSLASRVMRWRMTLTNQTECCVDYAAHPNVPCFVGAVLDIGNCRFEARISATRCVTCTSTTATPGAQRLFEMKIALRLLRQGDIMLAKLSLTEAQRFIYGLLDGPASVIAMASKEHFKRQLREVFTDPTCDDVVRLLIEDAIMKESEGGRGKAAPQVFELRKVGAGQCSMAGRHFISTDPLGMHSHGERIQSAIDRLAEACRATLEAGPPDHNNKWSTGVYEQRLRNQAAVIEGLRTQLKNAADNAITAHWMSISKATVTIDGVTLGVLVEDNQKLPSIPGKMSPAELDAAATTMREWLTDEDIVPNIDTIEAMVSIANHFLGLRQLEEDSCTDSD